MTPAAAGAVLVIGLGAAAPAPWLRPLPQGLGFSLPPGRPALLVQGRNPPAFSRPQPDLALATQDATELVIEWQESEGRLVPGCAVLALICDGEGRVLERPALPLGGGAARIALALPAAARGLAFALRLAGEGMFGAVSLAVTLAGRSGPHRRAARLVPAALPAATAWLDAVPEPRRLPLARQLLAAQGLALAGGWPAAAPATQAEVAGTALLLARRWGLAAALAEVLRRLPAAADRAAALETLAAMLEPEDRPAALDCCWLAYGCDPQPGRARRGAARLFAAGSIREAAALLDAAGEAEPTGSARRIREAAAQWAGPLALPAPAGAPLRGSGIAYVASSALPWVASGYTVRTAALLRALHAAGAELRCHLRPGFPWDRADSPVPPPEPPALDIEGIPHLCTPLPPGAGIAAAAEALEQQFRRHPPVLVQAASNHRSALPALIAARRLGLPFLYEMRGLWELSEASQRPGWEQTERFALDHRTELELACAADGVLAISRALADQLIAEGVPAARIEVLPNAVEPALFQPRPANPALLARLGLEGRGPRLVYAGSVTAYEGLDDLLRAMQFLRARRLDPVLLLLGQGPALAGLQGLAAELGLADALLCLPPVPAAAVPDHWALADIVALPRRDDAVCRLIPPLKPFEVLAMALPLVASDLPVMREIVEPGRTGLLTPPGDPLALARVLAKLAGDAALRRRLGEQGRAWVVAQRSWAANAAWLQALHARLLATGSLAGAPRPQRRRA